MIRETLAFAAEQYRGMLARLPRGLYPRTWHNEKLGLARPADWTSGFFPGALWYLYEATDDPVWRDEAAASGAALEAMKDNRRTHDIGFMLYCSLGNGFRLTRDPRYRAILLGGAESLASRFNPTVGCIKSWDTRVEWPFPVIIDNMMNLELLLWAAREGNEPRYREIAVAHANTTMRNHFRADHSCFHVVDYDPATGAPRKRQTHQGAADTSAWSRGQAWAVYGFTLMYRDTRDERYLEQAVNTANFFVTHPRLPADKVPYWDFDAPRIPKEPRDASAAAVMCSALIEMSSYLDKTKAQRFRAFASAQLASLCSPDYRATLGSNGHFLLKHSTGSYPRNSEVDVPLNYADYYFLEALLRAKRTT
jgi:unsaturated chondroitin disaccharide hydrolase